mmetsp:Transcript_91497/g.144561  ORF Transcript_91497/g.144561 Transcript_91497/m.144561 type:complete len:106 (-) Transcript_91497:312-629(-)
MANPWDCVCEFIRSQTANLQNVLQSLPNQNQFSDVGTGDDTLSVQSGISPFHLFMFLLLAVWGFLYVSGRSRQEATKPRQPRQGGSENEGPENGGNQGGSNNELF